MNSESDISMDYSSIGKYDEWPDLNAWRQLESGRKSGRKSFLKDDPRYPQQEDVSILSIFYGGNAGDGNVAIFWQTTGIFNI